MTRFSTSSAIIFLTLSSMVTVEVYCSETSRYSEVEGNKGRVSQELIPRNIWGLTDSEVEHLFKNSHSLICITATEGYLKRVNTKWEELLGWQEQELLSTPYIEFIHPEDLEKTKKKAQELVDVSLPEAPYSMPSGFTNRYRCKNGSYRWLEWTVWPKRLSQTAQQFEHKQYLCLAKDITQQKEKSLQSKNKIKLLNYELERKNILLSAVNRIQSAYIERRELNNHTPYLQLIIENVINISKSPLGYITELKAGGTTHTYNTPFLHCVLNSRTAQDISCNEKALKDSFKDLISTYLLKEGQIPSKPVSLGEKALKEMKLPPNLALSSLLIIPLTTNNKDNVLGVIGLANLSKETQYLFLEEAEPLLTSSARLLYEAHQTRLREEVRQQQARSEAAEAANQAKSQFLARVSHEMRTPLNGMLGVLDLIKSESLDEEDQLYLQTAKSSGQTLLSLLNDVLDASKIEAGEIKLEYIDFNPIMLAHEVISLFSPQAERKKLNLQLNLSPSIPASLKGDPTRLKQIFFNLISNALKFTEKGKVVVSLDGSMDKSDKQAIFMLHGEVRDAGIGMSHRSQQRLFKPFSQSDDSINRRFGGTGLGLYITKQLCSLMGGNINVESECDQGSKFKFNVQLLIGEPEQKEKKRGLESRAIHRLPPLHILVAEDNTANQLVLKTVLTRAGCTVDVVENGYQAIDAVKNKQYQLILMDGQMPGIDGLETTRRIRQEQGLQDIPIIGVTAHALLSDREKFLQAGMDGYVTKPLNTEKLKEEILNCINRKEDAKRQCHE